MRCDLLIVGAGIIGLTAAYELLNADPTLKIVFMEKEHDVALHASGLNSGVLHSGIYYGSQSLKAKHCIAGMKAMKNFCFENKISVNQCGKLIVARNEEEYATLLELYSQGAKNGANIELVDCKSAIDIEPLARTHLQSIWSPDTSSVNPVEVCSKLKEELIKRGAIFLFNRRACQMDKTKKIVKDQVNSSIKYGFLLNTAGLYADKISKSFGFDDYQILPFKGLYYLYKNESFSLKTNIYPVPDPNFPFLGVHFTLTASGKTKVGPTALPVLWREQYQRLKNFNHKEFLEISRWYLSCSVLNWFKFRTLARRELTYLFKKRLVAEANSLLTKPLHHSSFIRFRPGIRAQLFDKKKKQLVNDFLIKKNDNALHVLNAVSPAFTSSFSMAKEIVREVYE